MEQNVNADNASEIHVTIYQEPYENCYSIYSKTACKFCKEAKKLLEQHKIEFKTIDCDDYILENKTHFLDFMTVKTNQIIKTFPIIFNDKKQYIGGYVELEKIISMNSAFDDCVF